MNPFIKNIIRKQTQDPPKFCFRLRNPGGGGTCMAILPYGDIKKHSFIEILIDI